jgi:hypothetical protein
MRASSWVRGPVRLGGPVDHRIGPEAGMARGIRRRVAATWLSGLAVAGGG